MLHKDGIECADICCMCEHNKELWLQLFSAAALAEHNAAPMTLAAKH